MRVAATAVLVLALALFLQACAAPTDCAYNKVPELLAADQKITRNDVISEMGEPVETILENDGSRVDIYDTGIHCIGMIFLVPVVDYDPEILTVDYSPDGFFLTAQIWPDIESPNDFVGAHNRREKLEEACKLPFSEAIQLDATTQYKTVQTCSDANSLFRWQWVCLAAHQGHHDAQYDVANRYRRGSSPVQLDPIEAYKWLSLAAKDGDAIKRYYRDVLVRQLSPEQIAEAERLVAEWQPNPAECEAIAAQADEQEQ